MVQSQNMAKMKQWLRWKLLPIVGAVTLLGIGGYTLLRSQTPSSKVSQQTIPKVETVTALGYLEPAGELIKLSSPNSGGSANRVDRLLVKRGDQVRSGQVIAVLDSYDRLQAALVEAQQQVIVARSNLAVVKAGAKDGQVNAQRFEIARTKSQSLGEERAQQETVARLEAQWEGDKIAQTTTVKKLQAELNNALSELARYEQLYTQGAVSKSTYDSKRLPTQTLAEQLNEAKANLARTTVTGQKQLQEARVNLARIQSTSREQVGASVATLDQIEEVRSVDIAAAQAQVDRAIATVGQAQAQLNLAQVRAPQNGRVLEIHTNPGELIASEGIVELGQTQQMTAVLEVYETDIAKVKLGQSTKLFADSVPDGVSGKIVEIGVKVKRQNVVNSDTSANIDARIVQVRVRLDADSTPKVAALTNLQVTGEIQL